MPNEATDGNKAIHTIPVPKGYTVDDAWLAIEAGEGLPTATRTGRAPEWANVLVDEDGKAYVLDADCNIAHEVGEDVTQSAESQAEAVAFAIEELEEIGGGNVFVSKNGPTDEPFEEGLLRVWYDLPEYLVQELRQTAGSDTLDIDDAIRIVLTKVGN